MDIHSTALSVHVSGSHNFNNIMDYRIRLLLSEVLGRKVKEKKSINMEEIRENLEGKTTIQLNMKGHVDNPKISLDKVKIRKDIFKTIKEETNKVKEIFEEKILNKENNSTNNKVENESEYEIEWEDKK